MQLIVIAVRDAKSEAYGRPFFVNTIGQAVRDFDDEINRPAENNMLYKHPDDFSLWALGKFDDTSGSFETTTPKLLINGGDVKKYAETKISKV